MPNGGANFACIVAVPNGGANFACIVAVGRDVPAPSARCAALHPAYHAHRSCPVAALTITHAHYPGGAMGTSRPTAITHCTPSPAPSSRRHPRTARAPLPCAPPVSRCGRARAGWPRRASAIRPFPALQKHYRDLTSCTRFPSFDGAESGVNRAMRQAMGDFPVNR